MDDLSARLERLIELERGGLYGRFAERLHALLHETAYTTGSEARGEVWLLLDEWLREEFTRRPELREELKALRRAMR